MGALGVDGVRSKRKWSASLVLTGQWIQATQAHILLCVSHGVLEQVVADLIFPTAGEWPLIGFSSGAGHVVYTV